MYRSLSWLIIPLVYIKMVEDLLNKKEEYFYSNQYFFHKVAFSKKVRATKKNLPLVNIIDVPGSHRS